VIQQNIKRLIKIFDQYTGFM